MELKEKYVIDNHEIQNIKIDGIFNRKVQNKHELKYSGNGATRILNNAINIFSELEKQKANPTQSNNSLLVGKVQSGKTSCLETLSALAFDNGYKLMILYGGYDNSLLDQTTKRFKKVFDVQDDWELCSEYPAIFTTGDATSFDSLKDSFYEIIDEMPLIFISMKRPQAMARINNFLSELNLKNIKSLIIDDEGDQASLNTARDRENDASATYNQIIQMKQNLHDPLYLSVTATPQANIYLNNLSEIKPDTVHLIPAGEGYNGANEYHLGENKHIIEVDKVKSTDNYILPKSLKDAIKYFIVASAIKINIADSVKEKHSDMIIHSFREVDIHKGIFASVNSFIENFRDAFNQKMNVSLFFKEFEEVYDKYIDEEYKEKFPFNSLEDNIQKVVQSVAVILQNSEGKDTQKLTNFKLHKIYIGGDLLQRGLTFDNLITTYFTRWAKTGGNMDTTLQRARWFGYRNKYINLCKIFTTKEIALEFSNLAEMENDIWEQFADVEKGILRIEDIIISCSEDSELIPTNKIRVDYTSLSFKEKWKKQRCIVYDESVIKKNNCIMEKFINSLSWSNTSIASENNKITAKYTSSDIQNALKLFKSLDEIFSAEQETTKKEDLIRFLEHQDLSVYFLIMHPDREFLKRGLYGNDTCIIKGLHEGQNNTSLEAATFKGDREVLIDKNAINIQIFYIEPHYGPISNPIVLEGKRQYAFAIYVPGSLKSFIRR